MKTLSNYLLGQYWNVQKIITEGAMTMTLKELKETKIEIEIKDCQITMHVRGNNKAIGFLLGEAVAKIGADKTKELLSDIAISALINEKNVKKRKKNT